MPKKKTTENPSRGRATMHDIARLADVSLGTVSHVINGKVGVRPKVRARVQKVIDELRYQPNHLSRALRTNRTNLIGMIIPDIMNPFCNADNDTAKEEAYLSDLRSFLPAGIILTPSFEHKLSWVSEFPIVCIDRRPPDWEGDSVTVENFEGGYKAGRHLTLLGHRTIGIIRGPFNVVTANDRVRGFQKALREKGVELLPEYVHEGVFTQESGYICAMRLLRRVPRPTAIFAANDLIAFGALGAVKASKLKCPQDSPSLDLMGSD